MSYKDQINEVSSVITEMKKDLVSLKDILEEASLERFQIYQNNYLSLTFETLISDFPATFKYLGENNFKFFAHSFLKEEEIFSSCIFDLSVNFKNFIDKSYDIHQDDLIDEIMAIDLMWSQGNIEVLEISSGMLEFWQELLENKKSNKVINLNQKVQLELIEHQNEQAFKIKL